MTRENRTLVSPDEIRAVRWECQVCRTAITFPLDDRVRFPETCQCGGPALEQRHGPDSQAYDTFVRTLQMIVRDQRKEQPIANGTFLLEFGPPAAGVKDL